MFHHKFKNHEKGWDAHDQELYPIVFAFDHYRHFLAAAKFPVEVYSDHRNLAKFMFSTHLLKSHDGRLARWWQKLSGANFTIHYRTGETNVVADFLSRYGYEDTAALDSKILLPASRFSDKALADIRDWFRKTGSPNVREIIEKNLAAPAAQTPLSAKRTAPADLVQPSTPSATPLCSSETLPLTPACTLPALAHRPRLYKLLAGYSGTTLDVLLPSARLTRNGKDRRGIGM